MAQVIGYAKACQILRELYEIGKEVLKSDKSHSDFRDALEPIMDELDLYFEDVPESRGN